MTATQETGQQGMSPDRLQTLADGIFAIAMTLLVLNLQVPQIPATLAGERLPHALLDLWPKLLSFALSFVVVGVYWVGHHNQFHYIRRVDRPFIWLNILFLMCIAFVPFSAALLGQYVHEQIAVAIYGFNLVVVGAVLYLIWSYATTSRRLVDLDLSPGVVRAGGRRVLVGVVLYLVAVCLSVASTTLSVILFVLVPVLYILPGRIDRHLLGRLTPSDAGTKPRLRNAASSPQWGHTNPLRRAAARLAPARATETAMVSDTSGSQDGASAHARDRSSLDAARETLHVARECIESLNQGDKQRLLATLDLHAAWHSAATGETIEGSEDIARNLLGYRGTFPDLHEEITNAFASPDQATVETLVTGTYEGTVVPTIPGSGSHISLPLCYLLKVHGGKIAAITTYMDYRTMMAQLEQPQHG